MYAFLLCCQYQFTCAINQPGAGTVMKNGFRSVHTVKPGKTAAREKKKEHRSVNSAVVTFLSGETSQGWYSFHVPSQTLYFLWSRERNHMIISLHESQSRRPMENTVSGKLGARCDSQIDSHRRRSGATWVRCWNVVPGSAGGFMSSASLTHPVPVHPGGGSSEFLTHSLTLPARLRRWHCALTWIPLLRLLTSDLGLLSYVTKATKFS